MANLDIWNKLGRTDPEHTKKFARAGGFKGTAIKPIYTTLKMTEEFGPAGKGWGMGEPSFQTIPGNDGQVAVYCTVALWWTDPSDKDGTVNTVYGVGGDMVVVKQSAGLRTDDEAFKKAFTDAIGNAMKHLGMSADVHMGLFDDSKYVSTRAEEEQSAKTTSALDTHLANINGAETLDALQSAFKAAWTAITTEAPRAKLKAAYDALKAKLTPADDFPGDTPRNQKAA